MPNEKSPKKRDPRLYQIAVLGTLLLYGVTVLDFEVQPVKAAVIIASALACQWLMTRLFSLPRFDPKSALISGLSLCLLLRTNALGLAVTAAAVTIASKFLIRARGKHVFNPTNFGLAAMLLFADGVWVSAGQWGSAAVFGFFLAGLGGLVVHRARRGDVTWAFLAAYSALLCGRAVWLGDPWTIPLHQLQNGAFLIFAFFMISDPKTTPDTRPGRLLYATLVAAVALFIQFGLFEPNALLWALVGCAPLVPLVDRLLPGERYRWPFPERPTIETPTTLVTEPRRQPYLELSA
jgi:enediyne biosynthesis protein E5